MKYELGMARHTQEKGYICFRKLYLNVFIFTLVLEKSGDFYFLLQENRLFYKYSILKHPLRDVLE